MIIFTNETQHITKNIKIRRTYIYSNIINMYINACMLVQICKNALYVCMYIHNYRIWMHVPKRNLVYHNLGN